jgi:hypothetical protein
MPNEFIHIVKGIKVTEEQFRYLHYDYMMSRKENNDYDEGSKIFWMHEHTYGLNGYWIKDNNNPSGLIIGVNVITNSENEIEIIDLEDAVEESNKNIKDYEIWANEFLSENFENHKYTEFKTYIFKEKFHEGI